jgi:cephalosporin-C deacetylase-like acetyl esterase
MTGLPPSVGSFKDLMRIFDYNRKSPLDVEESNVEHRNGVSIHDISYSGLADGRVSAYLVQPAGKGPFAGIIFVHPGPGNRSGFLDEATTLAEMGAVSLLIDAPWAYPEFGERAVKMTAEDMRHMFVQTAMDIRRGVDLIQSLPEVDASRIGYVGHSLGALLGGVLSGVEKRINAYVLMAGTGSFTDVAVLNMPDLKGRRLEEYRETMEPIDPIYYVRHAAPPALFFQFGLQDAFYPKKKFLEYYEAGSDPKSIQWYEADHYRLNEGGRSDRIEWLRRQLCLKQAQ